MKKYSNLENVIRNWLVETTSQWPELKKQMDDWNLNYKPSTSTDIDKEKQKYASQQKEHAARLAEIERQKKERIADRKKQIDKEIVDRHKNEKKEFFAKMAIRATMNAKHIAKNLGRQAIGLPPKPKPKPPENNQEYYYEETLREGLFRQAKKVLTAPKRKKELINNIDSKQHEYEKGADWSSTMVDRYDDYVDHLDDEKQKVQRAYGSIEKGKIKSDATINKWGRKMTPSEHDSAKKQAIERAVAMKKQYDERLDRARALFHRKKTLQTGIKTSPTNITGKRGN